MLWVQHSSSDRLQTTLDGFQDGCILISHRTNLNPFVNVHFYLGPAICQLYGSVVQTPGRTNTKTYNAVGIRWKWIRLWHFDIRAQSRGRDSVLQGVISASAPHCKLLRQSAVFLKRSVRNGEKSMRRRLCVNVIRGRWILVLCRYHSLGWDWD